MPDPRKTAQAVAAVVLSATAIAACGGSSKPSYCSSVSTLESSIKALPSTNVIQNGVSALESAVSKVQTEAQTAVNDAKSDFPTETSALKSSVDTLSATVKKAVSSPSPATLVQLPAQVSAVVTAANNFQSATKSKCS
jgi:hypothetical protein